MKTLKKISIIVPIYNVEKYLSECLDSIINQTLKDIEIICINDGSPDNSFEILKRYSANDARIKIIDKNNEGVGKARNDGILAATGEFIAFMDSDDYYPSDNVLKILYNIAKENGVKVAGGRKIRLMPDGSFEKDSFSVMEHGMEFGATGLTDYSDFQYDYGYTQYIFEREMLIENEIVFPSYKRFQDPPFFVRAMNVADRFYVADIDSYCYRQLPGELKYSIDKTLDSILGLINNLKYSRENELEKLHYLTAMRLDKECSFMAIKNIFGEKNTNLISEIMRASSYVDTSWLKENGYDIREPFVPLLFDYLVSTAEKYEKIRNKKFVKIVSRIVKR